MAIPILATKLYIPPPPFKTVARLRLLDRLNDGLAAGRKLTLVSAPAGFGKSTLVSEWLASCRRPAAWLSLDEQDSAPVRFLLYLTSAMQQISPGAGVEVLEILQSPQPPPVESILTALLNEFAAIPDSFVVVLDDYHVLDAPSIDDALTFLIEHLPPQMHLVITTREDPALPIARLRARGQLTEIRAVDLRFTPAEAAEFLNQVMGLKLTEEAVAALEVRTEGWIAGLQLAALSMQGQRDIGAFIRAFAGDNRYIVDYLIEEVLQHQPEAIRTFLLQTAILERLNDSLCEAVTGQSGGKARLESLQRGNFFLIPLDDQRHWYRYHQLFADVLHMHLTTEQPDLVPGLHRRASEWYEQHGFAADAIRHALTAQDFERAAGLIELAAPALRQSRQEATLLGWLKALPAELFRNRPVLNIEYGGVLLSSGQLAGLEDRLQDAERWLETVTRPELNQQPIVMKADDLRRLPGMIAMYRAGHALALGNVPATRTYARQVLDLTAADDHVLRGAAGAMWGLAAWTIGELEAAHQSYADGMAQLQQAGHIADAIGGAIVLADIRLAQGRRQQARRTYELGLQLAREHGSPAMRGTADMYVGLSELEREQNNLQAAAQYLLKSKAQGEHTGFPQHPHRWRVAMARLQQTQGNLSEALDLLDEAERVYTSDFSPNLQPIAARKTRVWLAQGRLAEALGWVRERGLSVDNNLSYLREFEHITLARVLLAHGQSDRRSTSIRDAIGLLERLLTAARHGERSGSVIEILVVLALAHQLYGDITATFGPLEQALTLAEPEGYVRIFLDEGVPMTQLLRAAADHGLKPGYLDKLLASVEPDQHRRAGGSPLPDRLVPTPPAAASLIEPLSQRELDVLRLFKTDLSGPEIARELVVALSTVRTHTKSIYSKLNVSSRQAAVNRATELGLI